MERGGGVEEEDEWETKSHLQKEKRQAKTEHEAHTVLY